MTNTLSYSPYGGVIGNRLIFIGHLVAFIYPFVLLGGIYGTWLLAWLELGHMPRPSRDDPSQVLGVFYYTSTIPVLLFPGAAVVATASMGIRILQPGPRLAAIVFCVIVSALWLGAIILLRVDPWGVSGWWGD